MKPLVSIIMGSTSDLPVMEKACKWLNDNQIPFEVNALSAHRTPDAVESFAKGAKERGVKVIIAAAGMAAALPGVIAASTPLPVIGVPIKGMLDGLDAMLSIIVVVALAIQMICAFINVWWKISTHTAAIGGVAGALVSYSVAFNFNPLWWLCLVLMMAGAVGSARMILRQHTLSQVVAGFLIGTACAILVI